MEDKKDQKRTKVKRVKKKLSETVTYEDLLRDWTQCCYLLPKKQKLCNMHRMPGSKYCGTHFHEEKDEEVRCRLSLSSRIPCPIDPSHSIYEKDLQHHLKVCNIVKYQQSLESLPYYKQNFNSCTEAISMIENVERTEEQKELFIRQLLQKIDVLFSQVKLESFHPEDRDLQWIEYPIRSVLGISNGQNVDNRERSSFRKHWKHIEQDIAITKQLIRSSLLTPSLPADDKEKAQTELNLELRKSTPTVYIEYGAGKGLLGLTINVLDPSAQLLFIEKSGNRRKIDRYLNERNCKFQRFRLDIRHCFLPKLPFVEQLCDDNQKASETHRAEHSTIAPTKALVAIVAKHLCGVATDLALRSLLPLCSSSFTQDRGIAIATCCHHSCQYEDYVGREVQWLERGGISTKEEFEILKYWSAWATLDLQHLRKKKRMREEAKEFSEREDTQTEHVKEVEAAVATEQKEGGEAENGDDMAEPEHSRINFEGHRETDQFREIWERLLSYEQMFDYGRKIKRIFDYGRILFMQEKLFLSQTRLQQYCEETYSPEAFMIIGNYQF